MSEITIIYKIGEIQQFRGPEDRKSGNSTDWRRVLIAWIIGCCLFPVDSFSQNLPFQSGEKLYYDISYKYGIVMMKAGTARYRIDNAHFDHQPAILSALDFKTTSFFDKIYKIRDTLYSYSDVNLFPVYHKRHVNEGSTNYMERIFFLKRGDPETEARIKRETKTTVKLDTTLVSEASGYDLLGIFAFARSLDYNSLELDQLSTLSVFVGKRVINIIIRYKGQSIVEKSNTLKYNTFRLEIDIVDEAFESAKNAMEIWISNDQNRIPIKMKAKLRIGAAEVFLTSYENLKYPLSSEIRIKKK
ncbi:MAG: DUF3108 domain-containing protein [Dysgonamonadaceae bacterium]|jgi:hypothetical protein|nr:DUF3108 domain-containing protein [Dysgonamonadaceae bacterium]